MPRAAFRQAEIERIIRAATNSNAEVLIDMKTLTVRITPVCNTEVVDTPSIAKRILPPGNLAQDGKENWNARPSRLSKPKK